MNYKLIITLGITLIVIINCSKPPEVIPDEIVDFSYDELKQNYTACKGDGIMTAKGLFPWKLNYTFTTQNDSSFIQFKDIFGRRVLFVQALPNEIKLWDMQKNVQYNPEDGNSIPMFDILESYDIAQILWGEIPNKYVEPVEESGFDSDSNLVNFESSSTQLGMTLNKVLFKLDSYNAVIEFTISERDYGKQNSVLLKGIPQEVPYY